jgi:subfamily B ATP-binding cassette protein MsbA
MSSKNTRTKTMALATPASQLLRRIWHTYVQPHWRWLLVAFVFMLAEAGTITVQAKMMEPTINDIFVNKQAGRLLFLGQAIFAIFVVRGLVAWTHTVIMARMGNQILAQIQRDLFGNILRQDLAFFQKNLSGVLVSSMTNDVGAMRWATAESFTGLGKNVITLAALVGLMFYQNWQLSVFAFVVFPISAFVTVKVGRRLRQLSGQTQGHLGTLNALLGQAFQGIRQIKTYQAEKTEIAKVDNYIVALLKVLNKTARVSNLSTPISEILTGIAVVTIILVGGSQVVHGTSTAGQFSLL